MEPRLALDALEAIATGAQEKLARCPACDVRCSIPLAIADDPRFHITASATDSDSMDPMDARAMKCAACGEGWMEQSRVSVEETWMAWSVWNALHRVGWFS